MPLSKERMRERKKQDRVKPMSNLNNDSPVKPSRLEIARAALVVKPKTDAPESNLSPIKEENSSRLPRMTEYNRKQFKPGDRVSVLRGKRWLPYLVPDMDGSGQEIPEFY